MFIFNFICEEKNKNSNGKETKTTNPNENIILVDTVSEPDVPSIQNPKVVLGQPNQSPPANPNLVFLPHGLFPPQRKKIQPTEAAKPAMEVNSRPLASLNSSSVNSFTSLNGTSINSTSSHLSKMTQISSAVFPQH